MFQKSSNQVTLRERFSVIKGSLLGVTEILRAPEENLRTRNDVLGGRNINIGL